MQALLDWLVTVPQAALLAILLFASALENLFPPFPADVIVAFGSFVAAQAPGGSMPAVFLAVWFGNVASAMLVFALGRRYGAERLERRLAGKHAESRDARIRRMFDRYGLLAVFVSRFVPGVRALVPAFAGALRLPIWWTTIMIGLASAIWYGLITVIAFRVGSDWAELSGTIAVYGSTVAIVAAVILALGFVVWWIANRRNRTT